MKYIKNFLLICFLLVITLSGCKTNYKETDSSYFKFRSAYSDYIEIYEFDKENFNEEQLIIPSQYNGKKVISITKEAFNDLYFVKVVKLPKYLVELNDNFNNCKDLEIVVLNKKLSKLNMSFYNCESLKEIKFNNNIKFIGSSFSKCSSIETLTMPSSLEEISTSFYDCLKLKVIKFPIFSKIEKFSAFNNCPLIEEVRLPNSIENLYGFVNCISLKTIKFPNNVEEIGGFDKCNSLTKITIPNSVEEIAAFDYCENLVAVYFESGCEIEMISGFNNCEKLVEFTIPSNTKVLCNFMNNTSIKTITIPKSIGKIDARCFNECLDLEKVIFEENSELKVVNESCFKSCPKLGEVNYPNDVEIQPYPTF